MAVVEEVADDNDARTSSQITQGFIEVKFLSLSDVLVTSEWDVPVTVEKFLKMFYK
jgi:hypothetical protein